MKSNYVNLKTRDDFQDKFRPQKLLELPENKIFSLSEIQKIALENNLEYRSLSYSIHAAKRRYYQSLNGYLPQVNMSGAITNGLESASNLKNPPADIYRRRNALNVGFSLQATYLIFDGLEREVSLFLAANEYKQELKTEENFKRILLRAISYVYYDAILAQEELRIAEADLAFQLSSLAQAQNRYKFGFVSKAAVLNFQILANQARCDILNASYRYDCAIFALINLMGYDELMIKKLELQKITDSEKNLFGKGLLSLAAYLDIAVANRPDLQRSLLILENAELKKKGSYAEFMPQIYLKSGLDFEHEYAKLRYSNFRNYRYDDLNFYYGAFGNWNIFNGFADYNKVKELEAYEKYYLLQLGKKYIDIINEVKDAYVNYRKSCEEVRLYQQSCQWVKEQRELVQAEYWGGQDTINRLNGAQSAVVEAESNLAISVINAYKALAQLEAAVNLPLDFSTDHLDSLKQ